MLNRCLALPNLKFVSRNHFKIAAEKILASFSTKTNWQIFYSNGMLKFMTQIPNYIIIFVIYCNHPTSFQSDIWKDVKM